MLSLLLIPAIIATAVLPALIWLIFFLREDIHPEPTRLIARTILLGALATVPALALQIFFREIMPDSAPLLIFAGLAFSEEIAKFVAAQTAVGKSKFLDEPIDAMIYMVAAASGFATVENVLIAVGSLEHFAFSDLFGISNILLIRFVGATLLHILSSAVIGYYWAKARKFTRSGLITYGVVLATLVHALFNYLIAAADAGNLIYPSLILVVAAFFVLNDFEILKKTTPQET